MKKISLFLIVTFFLFAGFNHFRDPEFYFPLIPDYLPFPKLINVLSGTLEIGLGAGLIFDRTRRLSSISLIALLIVFIPSHIHFIILGGCVSDGLCVPAWVAWLRLLLIHPLLLIWIWWHRK